MVRLSQIGSPAGHSTAAWDRRSPPIGSPPNQPGGRQVPQHLSHCPSFSSKGSTNSYKNLNSQISQRTDQHHGGINSLLWPLPPPFLLFFFFPNMIFALLLGLEGHYDLGIENVSRATNQRVFGIRGMDLFRPSFTASSVLHCLREMRTCGFFFVTISGFGLRCEEDYDCWCLLWCGDLLACRSRWGKLVVCAIFAAAEIGIYR